MASGSEENKAWWSSWLTTARDKSWSALDATKRDLAEFVSVVQKDTSTAVNDVASKVINMVNQEDDSDSDNKDSTDSGPSSTNVKEETKPALIYDRNQAELESIRSDPATYCTPPEDKDDEWSSSFDAAQYQDEISKLLVSSSSVRKLHSELVPAKVSYESFWHNYFFRIHLLGVAEAKRAEIMARAHSQGQLICWDEDDDHGIEDVGTEDIGDKGRSMTDSSDSFICINEEGVIKDEDNDSLGDLNSKESKNEDNDSLGDINSKESTEVDPSPSDDKKEDDDSDWEKWD